MFWKKNILIMKWLPMGDLLQVAPPMHAPSTAAESRLRGAVDVPSARPKSKQPAGLIGNKDFEALTKYSDTRILVPRVLASQSGSIST